MVPLEEQIQFVESALVARERVNELKLQQGVISKYDAEREAAKIRAVLDTLRDYERMSASLARYEGMVLDAGVSERLEQIVAEGGCKAALREMLQQHSRTLKRMSEMERMVNRMQRMMARYEARDGSYNNDKLLEG